jgi:hypothetical protein
MKSFPHGSRGTKTIEYCWDSGSLHGRRLPTPQADTESRFSSKPDLEPDPNANMAESLEAKDGFRNRQRPLSLGRRNWSSCP